MASFGYCGPVRSSAIYRSPSVLTPRATTDLCAGAGVWSRIIEALAAAHDAAVQMIDTSIVRVHQHGACLARNKRQAMGRSRGGLTSKIHAVVDSNGLPVRLALTSQPAKPTTTGLQPSSCRV